MCLLQSADLAEGSYLHISDIDLMFIFKDSEDHESEIQNCVTELWDAGIEVSHTVREFSDIENLLQMKIYTHLLNFLKHDFL